MKKQIVFEEDEFNCLLIKFTEEFIKQQNKGFGVSLISNEDNNRITSKESIIGSFFMTWNNVFKEIK